jgi:hypothetical protein
LRDILGIALPIRDEYRKFYGQSWRTYRAALIRAHGYTCTVCGRKPPKYLSLAHVTHDPRSSEVRLMCMACHNRHDARFRLAVMRRRRAARYGQGWLWREVECAVTPLWLIRRPKTSGASRPTASLFQDQL